MTNELTPIPARILLQIREGNLNLLADFEVKVASSETRPDGVIEHETSLSSVISGLAIALKDQVATYIRDGEDTEADKEWLAKIRDWIFEEAS